jgi:bacteriochlorophyll C8 methyltransferase
VLALLKGEPEPIGYVDLDWLPWPEDEDISRIEYDEINHYKRGTIQLYPTRGCPLSCTFCVVPTYYGGHGKSHKSHRTRNVDDVCDEIEYLADKYAGRFSGCYFNEEAHNANVEWFVSFCETLIKRGLNRYQYDCMAGAWVMTEELTALMARAGYRQFRFGVESTSEKVGRTIKKTIHKEKIEQVLGWLKKYNVGAYITLQVGAMGSTEETDIATIKDAHGWIQRGLVQKWQLSTSTPQPNTPFYEQAKANGWLVTEDFRYFNGWNAVVDYPDYPAQRIQAVRAGCGL